jgi:hypothetical protein
MADSQRSAGLGDWLWLLAVLLVGGAMIVTEADRTGGTFDEAFYLETGLNRWRTGSTAKLMDVGTMPLPVDVQTLPLYLIEQVRGIDWNLTADFREMLTIARRGTLIFWALALIYGWRIARSIGGPWAGRLAVLTLALEPTHLAHAALATTDVAITACILMFAYHYRAGRDGPWMNRVGLPALLGGIAILAKASAIVFCPLCVLAIEFERRWLASVETAAWPRFKESIRALLSPAFRHESAVIAGLALVLTCVYCGNDFEAHPKIVAAAYDMQPGTGRDICVWLAGHARIFNNAFVGLWFQIHHNMHGHGSFLVGEVSPRAVWYYFPVALSIKLPVAILMTPLILALVARRSLFNWPILASLMLLIFSLNCRVQIGVRMQLPLIALACVGMCSALPSLPLRGVAGAWAATMSLWLGVAAVNNWPRHLSYINELYGGPEHGEELVSDSNFDWGQGLPDLAAWAEKKGLSDVPVWYFGTDPQVLQPPLRLAPLHGFEITNGEQLRHHVGARYLAVSTTISHGSYLQEPSWLLRRAAATPPVDRTRTFLIYDVDQLTGEPRP